jgi:hypothetical protein
LIDFCSWLNYLTGELLHKHNMMRGSLKLLLAAVVLCPAAGVQKFLEPPTYREVNPGGDAVLPCVVADLKGECRWEKDGEPVGIYEGKYEWVGTPEKSNFTLYFVLYKQDVIIKRILNPE